MNWRDYLVLAENLEQTPDEAHQRSAISRAYYSAYHRALAYCETALPSVRIPETGEAHDLVWRSLGTSGRKQERNASVKGDRLRAARRKADYRGNMTPRPADVRDAIANAKAIWSSLDDAEREHRRASGAGNR